MADDPDGKDSGWWSAKNNPNQGVGAMETLTALLLFILICLAVVGAYDVLQSIGLLPR